jgi:hypothetical protein
MTMINMRSLPSTEQWIICLHHLLWRPFPRGDDCWSTRAMRSAKPPHGMKKGKAPLPIMDF